MVDKLEAAEMAAFGASDAACYLYPGEHQQAERAAFCDGAAHAVKVSGSHLNVATPANGEQVERVARAMCDRINGQGDYDDNPERHAGWNAQARAAIAAMDPTPTTDARERVKARPFSEWHEDYGNVLWWKLPIMESPYCGSPLDLGRGMKVTVQIGFEEHEMPIAHTGGWPFSEDDEPDLWWSPLPSPTFFRTALGNKETDRHG